MAYRDYICCRDCKSKFIYDGNDSIRNALEAAYGDENAPNWTVKLVCPNCLARLERKPLTEGKIHRTTVLMGFNPEWKTEIGMVHAIVRAIERAHGIGGES